MIRILIVLSAIILTSCSQSIDIQLDPEVNVYLSDDRNKIISITSEDKSYVELNEWLREHDSGWYPTSGHYPGGVYIKTGVYGIQVTERQVILYSTAHPEPRSIYIQKVAKGELSKIVNIDK